MSVYSAAAAAAVVVVVVVAVVKFATVTSTAVELGLGLAVGVATVATGLARKTLAGLAGIPLLVVVVAVAVGDAVVVAVGDCTEGRNACSHPRKRPASVERCGRTEQNRPVQTSMAVRFEIQEESKWMDGV